MAREKQAEGRYLKSTKVGGFTLLNNEKLDRVLSLLEGLTAPANSEEGRIVKEAQALKDSNMCILALYDRLGGGVKDGERKLKMGTFFDFKARKPRTKPEIDESDYEDELVLVRKKNRKSSGKETETERIKRLENKNSGTEEEPEEIEDEEEETEDTTEEVLASDAAKEEAAKLGVDLTQVTGSGANGNITVTDVRKAAPTPETE